MQTVTFQVLEGVDKGRIFRALAVPMTIGREEGNQLRLNDERVSRYHAKIQQDNGDVILTDLESTNGTRVNGNTIQIRRLRAGDRIGVGRSILLFGSNEEIAARMAQFSATGSPAGSSVLAGGSSSKTLAVDMDQDLNLELDPKGELTIRDDGNLFLGVQPLPPLPQKLTPAQVARLAEIFDFLHHGLTAATESMQADEEGAQIVLNYADWQRVQMVQMLLARYLRLVADPDS